MRHNNSTLSQGLALRERVFLFSAPLIAATQALVKKPLDGQFVVSQLMMVHQITRASVPLMEAACSEARRRSADGICTEFVPYLENHIEEERNHDKWVLEDLESVGLERSKTLSAVPSAHIASMVGAQYYWIHHYHPIALVGYMIMLEANAPTQALIAELQRKSGLPNSVFRSHHVHAELDPDHQSDIFKLVERLPLDSHHEQLIASSVAHTAEKLSDLISIIDDRI